MRMLCDHFSSISNFAKSSHCEIAPSNAILHPNLGTLPPRQPTHRRTQTPFSLFVGLCTIGNTGLEVLPRT